MKLQHKSIIITIAIAILLLVVCSQSASALSGYSYTKSNSIIGSTDGAQTNYQIKFVVHSGTGTDSGQDIYLMGHSLSWPNDIRFTDTSDNPLSYWIESYSASMATIWVKVPSIPESPGTTVKIYYGKSGDSGAGSIDSTFPFGDDFSGAALDTSRWTASGTYSVAGGAVTIGPSATSYIYSKNASGTLRFGQGYDVMFSSRWSSGSGAGWIGWSNTLGTSTIYMDQWSLTRLYYGDETTTGNIIHNIFTWNGNYHNFEVARYPGHTRFWGDGTLWRDETSIVSTNARYVIAYGYSNTLIIDWIAVRKYTANEPQHGSWSAETYVNGSFPSSYDLRNYGKVSPVKDQVFSGPCWTFAAYGSLESTRLPGDTSVFSENNMKNTAGFDGDDKAGGDYLMATAYLSRWNGPVISTLDSSFPNTTSLPNLPIECHVQNVTIIPDKNVWPYDSTFINNVKSMIMTYGAISTQMWWDNTSYSFTNCAYYYSGTNHRTIDHNVAIIGWDDSYSRFNFATTPPGNGAFIIKDSHGTSWGNNGYVYLSYYDNCSGLANAVFTAEPLTNYGKVYQYDPLGLINLTGFNSNTAWYANVFTADSNLSLAAVSTYTFVPNATYTVYIYNNPNNDPINSSGLIGQTSGSFQWAGYHTIPLNPVIPLIPGNKFSVVIQMTTPESNIPIPIENPETDYSSNATASPGQSYISPDGTTWTDMTSSKANTNVNIKAFTIKPDGTPNNLLNNIATQQGPISNGHASFENGIFEINHSWSPSPARTVSPTFTNISTNTRTGIYAWNLNCNVWPSGYFSDCYGVMCGWVQVPVTAHNITISFWAKGTGQYVCNYITMYNSSWVETGHTWTPWIYSTDINPNTWTYFQYTIPLFNNTRYLSIGPLAEGNVNVNFDDYALTTDGGGSLMLDASMDLADKMKEMAPAPIEMRPAPAPVL